MQERVRKTRATLRAAGRVCNVLAAGALTSLVCEPASAELGALYPEIAGVASGSDATLSFIAAPSVPPQGGRLGGEIAVDMRYGFTLGQVVLSGGARVEAGWSLGVAHYALLPTVRLAMPFSLVSCYVFGGFGYGQRLGPAREALALDTGGGMVVPLSDSLALGGEASYFQLLGQTVRLVSVGPMLTYRL